jgi:hypothetical protein
VAELVDAADSKSAIRKDVLVRFQSRAQSLSDKIRRAFLFCSMDLVYVLFVCPKRTKKNRAKDIQHLRRFALIWQLYYSRIVALSGEVLIQQQNLKLSAERF